MGISTKVFFIGVSAVAATTAFGNAPSGHISATLFDGAGNKEVLSEASHPPREQAPAQQQQAAPAPAQQETTETITDGKGDTIRTIKRDGDTTVVTDGKGRVVSSTTKNSDGSTTTRDGQGRVRATTESQPAK